MLARRDVLDRLHHLGEVLAVLGAHRRERHAAVAHHHRRHAVPARRREQRVPADLRVEMGVQVDEARRDQPVGRVDLASAAAVDLADRDDAVAADPDVGRPTRRGPVPSITVPLRMTRSSVHRASRYSGAGSELRPPVPHHDAVSCRPGRPARDEISSNTRLYAVRWIFQTPSTFTYSSS